MNKQILNPFLKKISFILKYGEILFFLLLSAFSLQALSSPSAIIPEGSDLYRDLSLLFRDAGRATPPPVYPMTQSEFLFYMKELETAELSSAGQSLLGKLKTYFQNDQPLYADEEGFAFDAQLTLQPELYIAGNTKNSVYQKSSEERPSAFLLENQIAWGPFLFAQTDLAVREEIWAVLGRETGNLHTNVILGQNELDASLFPRAFIASAGQHWSAQFGRDRLNLGNGQTGNMQLSNGVPYHDFLRLSTWWKRAHFSFTALNVAYYGTGFQTRPVGDQNVAILPQEEGVEEYTADKESRYYLVHRFDLRPFDQLRLSFSESVIYRDKNFNFRYMNPLYFFHSHFLKGQADYFGSIEFNWTSFPGFEVYGQMLVDQFSVEGVNRGGKTVNIPSATGLLGGLSYSIPLGTSYWTQSVELVKLDPYNYIDMSGVHLYAHYSIKSQGYSGSTLLYPAPLGYNLGNDLWRVFLKSHYLKPSEYELFVSYDFLAKGDKKVTDLYPSPEESTSEAALKSPSGLAYFQNTLGLGGSYNLPLLSSWVWKLSLGLYGIYSYQEMPAADKEKNDWFNWQAQVGLQVIW